MRREIFLMTLLGAVAILVSCSTDDGNGGSGGQVPSPVLANLYATSNTSSKVAVLNFTPQGVQVGNFNISSNNNEGIFYDENKDELLINSRTQKVINTYSNIENTSNGDDLNLLFSSSSVLDSPRGLISVGEFYIVSDDADLDGDPDTDEGRFFIFERTGNGLTLRNTVRVDYAVRGIQLIGKDLYTPVANTGDVAVLKDFLSTYTTDGTAIPDKRISIERMRNIHGIAEDGGVVVLTDVGDQTNDSDGGFHTINQFVSKFNATPDGDTLSFSNNQVQVSGRLTQLGNPEAVDYDNSRRTVFIAERTNEGGKILLFSDVEAGGQLMPTLSVPFEGASSLYFVDR